MLTAILVLLVLAIGGGATLAYFTVGQRNASNGAGLAPVSGQAFAGAGPSTITVVADGQAKGAPDVATLNLGVQTTGSTAAEAMSNNTAAMSKVVDQMKSMGIAEKDLQTQGLNVFPITGPQTPNDTTPPEKIRGYRANNTLNVTVNDLSKAGALLDAAIQAGANTSGGINFGLKDSSALREQAEQQAASAARAQADSIAKSMGVHITGAVSVSESVANRPLPAGVASAASAPVTPIQPGQMTVSVQLQASYSFAR